MSFSLIGLLLGCLVAGIVWVIGAWFIAKVAPTTGDFPFARILQIVLAIVCLLIVWYGALGQLSVHL